MGIIEKYSALSNSSSLNTSGSIMSIQLVVEKEKSFEEEDVSDKVESWGVYIPTPEKSWLVSSGTKKLQSSSKMHSKNHL